MNKEQLYKDLEKDEGLRLKPYRCSAGKLTIGYGRNLDDKGINKAEAQMLLINDVKTCIMQCRHGLKLKNFNQLNDIRQNILINMCFNLGLAGLKKFKKFLYYLQIEDFDNASKEMLDSKWAIQVGSRANRLAEEMRTGSFSR